MVHGGEPMGGQLARQHFSVLSTGHRGLSGRGQQEVGSTGATRTAKKKKTLNLEDHVWYLPNSVYNNGDRPWTGRNRPP
ncbi:hypothetical protein PDE_00434 [Penicillium oxalicum 114-2]|uniref:Uncharacterized protein n=1 Tax=Penicillium oxalicum (strain 114-2 / CGMCC 5302) TaxID=933388 RepID=S7Z9Z3_PENO1|nr:hypothetical protein PDE_00434 [Penicillium oxalicum 114-2]